MKKVVDKINNYKHIDIVFYTIIIVLSYLLMMSISNHIGLYYDSVNPDHLSPFVLDKIKAGDSIFSYPVLGKVYHGMINTYVMAFIIAIVGVPSATLLHFVSASYGAFICSMVYHILKKCNVNKIISGLLSILASISTSLLCIYITQFYVELSGMVFEIIAINLFINWIKKRDNKTLLFVGILSGLACYGYYNYAFFIPSYICVIIANHIIEKKKNCINSIMIFISGLMLGLTIYIYGYSQMIFNNNIVICVISFIWISWAIYNYIVFKKNIKNQKKLSIFFLILIGIFCIHYYLPLLLNTFSSMSDDLNKGLFSKILSQINTVKNRYFGLLNATTIEKRLLGTKSICTKGLINYLSLILILISNIIMMYKRKKSKKIDKSVLYVFITILIYFLVSFFIALSALSEQHFVPMVFINIIALGISIQYIINNIKNNKISIMFEYIVTIFIFMSIILNVYCNRIIISKLYYTGGINGAYSTKINDIAYEAMDNYNRNIKEIYIFEEWGYGTSFTYLTNNLVPYIEDYEANIDINEVIDKYIDDYQIAIYYKKDNLTEEYLKILNNYSFIKYSFATIYMRNGDLAYNKIIIDKNE